MIVGFYAQGIRPKLIYSLFDSACYTLLSFESSESTTSNI
jgi:hypothetical protein